MTLLAVANVTAIVIMPVVMAGLIGRTKSLWSGRKGPPILQLAYDLWRLVQKQPVYSTTTTPLFRLAPQLFLVSSLCSAAIAPLLGTRPLASFQFDFVWFAYVWALGRVGIMLAALDTGSSFEGMGAAREAVFSSILEPALFVVMGALSFFGGHHTLHEIVTLQLRAGGAAVVWILATAALLIILQVETSRMPVDDPTTHLELTMVHEVMVLDHSGSDLAAIQFGVATKLFVGASLIATLLNPWAGTAGLMSCSANLALCCLIAILLGTVESLTARLKLRAVPQYIAAALACGGVALLATIWRVGAGK